MTTPSQSFTYNAYQSNLAGPLPSGLTNVILDYIPPGLGVPAYLVIDPDVPASREYIKVLAYTNNTVDNMIRNLEGSAGDVDHLVGAVIRAVYTMQHLDDTFFDIGANADALVAHAGDVGDPHAAAGYIKQVEADAQFLRLDGTSPMEADLPFGGFKGINVADPVDPQDAATKAYADLFLPLTGGVVTGATTFTSSQFVLSNLSPTGTQANVPNIWMDGAGRLFEQTDPQGAADARYLKLTGGTLTGNLVVSDGSNSRSVSVDRDVGGVAGRLTLSVANLNGATPLITSFRDAAEGAGIALLNNEMRVLLGGTNGTTIMRLGPSIMELPTFRAHVVSRGSQASPAFQVGPEGNGMYSPAGDQIALSNGGVQSFFATTVRAFLPQAYNDTTANAANMHFLAGGRVMRSTSTLAIKSNVATLDLDESRAVIAALDPIGFTSDMDGDKGYVGFGAEPTAAADARLEADENYDVRGIVAHLTRVVQGLVDA